MSEELSEEFHPPFGGRAGERKCLFLKSDCRWIGAEFARYGKKEGRKVATKEREDDDIGKSRYSPFARRGPAISFIAAACYSPPVV